MHASGKMSATATAGRHGVTGDTQMAEHISKRFDSHLEALRKQVIVMADKVVGQLTDALNLLTKCHLELGMQVDKAEDVINAMHVAIDDECAQIIAMHQPAASDLRYVLSASRIVNELEQIANRSQEIARCGERIYKTGKKKIATLPVILEQSAIAVDLLRSAVDAYAKHDARIAISANQVNTRLRIAAVSIQYDIADLLPAEMQNLATSLEMTEIAKINARLGEHIRTIAMHVAYLCKGIDLRHADLDTIEKEIG